MEAWEGCRGTSQISCHARPCLLVAVARLAGRWCFWHLCSWRWCFSLACGFGVFRLFPFARAPTLGRVFFRRCPLRCSRTLIPSIRSQKSATDQMVGDRRSSRATVLEGEVAHFLRQPSLLGPPTGSELRDGSWTVYELAGLVLQDGCDVAASFLTRCRGSRNLLPRRCGDFGFVSRGTSLRNTAFGCFGNSRR